MGSDDSDRRRRSISVIELTSDLQPTRLLLVLLTVVVALLALSSATQALLRTAPGLPMIGVVSRIWYIDTERSIPTAYSFLLLLASAALLAVVAILERRLASKRSRLWFLLSALFVALALDEYLALHETAIEPLRGLLGDRAGGAFHFAWVLPALVFVVLVGLVFLRFVLALPRATRNAFIVAGALYVSGAVLMEMVGGAYVESNSHEEPAYLAINSVEEGLEMVGASVFLVGLVRHLLQHFGGFTVRLSPNDLRKP